MLHNSDELLHNSRILKAEWKVDVNKLFFFENGIKTNNVKSDPNID